jgi:hypothetical protein
MTSLAQELPQGLVSENDILAAGFKLFKEQHGHKSACYYFYYNEDFPADVINEYRWLESNRKLETV